jgi:succinate-acetate transporter protein
MSQPATVSQTFAESTPLGLIGLAVGCAALVPVAFGWSTSPAALKTAAVFCLAFGGGGQLLAGIMALANKNLHGGTLFTAFAFNWVLNWWALEELAAGRVPDHGVILAVDVCFLLVFLAMTWVFGYFSKVLFLFLLDIDLLFVARLVKAIGGVSAMNLPIAVLTVGLALIALWIAFALLVNPAAGRAVFPVSGPMWRAGSDR